MQIQEIKNKEVWEDFLSRSQEKSFLQSWNWGEFQKTLGNKIWRLSVLNNRELFSLVLVIKIQAKRGTFLFVPHAPSVALAKEGRITIKYGILKILLKELKKIGKEERASFIRLAPIWERNKENIEAFKSLGFRRAPIHMHPELTWELYITPSEDKLLMGMRKTTRYLIKKAQKNRDIKIIKSKILKDIEAFNNLYQKTVLRHHFVPFSLDYLKNEFLAFSSDNQIAVFLVKYKEEVISSAIVIFWQNKAFYHHGASSLKYPKIPASYLLQWEAIKEGKNRGCRVYNFWGIAPTNKKTHPWAGLTLFKKGFGGYKKEYVKTQDFPLSNRYWITYVFEKIRKLKRRL